MCDSCGMTSGVHTLEDDGFVDGQQCMDNQSMAREALDGKSQSGNALIEEDVYESSDNYTIEVTIVQPDLLDLDLVPVVRFSDDLRFNERT